MSERIAYSDLGFLRQWRSGPGTPLTSEPVPSAQPKAQGRLVRPKPQPYRSGEIQIIIGVEGFRAQCLSANECRGRLGW